MNKTAKVDEHLAPLLIGGEWREGREGRRCKVLDPATNDVIGEHAVASDADIAEAALAADGAMSKLAALGALGRATILRDAAGYLLRHRELIAHTLTCEHGKPLREARIEIDSSAELLEWFGEEARRTYGRVIPPRRAGVRQLVLREPVGPVAAFAPWNFPLSQLARKVGPALAAGCPVVLKPAEETPQTAIWLARAFAEVGLPGGALNLLFGDPAKISGALIAHPAIRKVSFTGSIAVGKQLAALAGLAMKRATMELGGHAPAIVTSTADIGRAVEELGRAKFRNAGQVCVSPTRFLVEAPAYEEFRDRLATLARGLRVGAGRDEDNDMGPLAHARRVEAMEAFVADAVDHGGEVLCGGRRVGNKGNFYAPTVIAGAHSAMRAMNDEPFGPIALVSRVESLDAAIAEANRLPVGLAAYAYCGADQVDRIAAEVTSGMISINQLGLALAETPFGGVRESGYGSEGGSEALEAYLVSKFVSSATIGGTHL